MPEKQYKAQVSFFLLVGIVLFAITAIAVFVTKSHISPILSIPQNQNNPVSNYVGECIKSAISHSAYEFGLNAGFYEFQNSFLETENRLVYYYHNVRSKPFFEDQLSKYAREYIFYECGDFSDFEEQGYTITSQTPSVTASIQNDFVSFIVNYPIEIKREGKAKVSHFSYDLPFRIGHILNISNTIIQKFEENPLSVDVTFLSDQDLSIQVYEYNRCSHIYLLIDANASLETDPYIHQFALKIPNCS